MPEPAVAVHPAPAAGAGQPRAVHPRLEAAFRALDVSSVPWCLLRGEDELANPGGDVDLLVDARSFAPAREALSALGFAHVPAPGRGPHRFLVAYDDDADRWLKLDVVLELAYGSHQEMVAPGAGAAVLGRRRRDGMLWLPAPHDGFWTLLLHTLLDRSGVRTADVEWLARLAGVAGEGPPPELRGVLPADAERTVVGLAATRDVSGLNAVSARAREATARKHRLRVVMRRAARRLARRSGLLGRRGIVVALLGPDGAGKSSLAGGIAGAFPVSVHRVYGGLYARGRRTRVPLVGRMAQSVLLGLEARAARARGRVVVFDRHPYDGLVPPRRRAGMLRRLRRRLLARSAVVRPDLVLLLDAPPEVLYARKAEHDLEELDRQRRAYRSLEAQLPRVATVDVGRAPEVVRREATRLIWHRYAQSGESTMSVRASAGPHALERDERPVTAKAQDGIDFDVHGLVGVRLLDAGPREAAAVRRQLGIAPAPLDREPDLSVRFVDRLARAAPVRYLGPKDVGFTDDAFLVLRGKRKSQVRVHIPLGELGRRPTILCERGATAIPFLVPILNLTALTNGALPLHASAFVHEGRGVVATGWSKGGKTEALLAFAANGARYVGDEWVYLSDGGRRAYGLAEPIRVWKWHLRELPKYRTAIDRGDRARLRALGALLALDRAAGRLAPGPSGRARHVLEDQQRVDVDPERLFGAHACVGSMAVDTILFVVSRDTPGVTVEAADPVDVAARMVASLQHERLDFQGLYLKWKFAFPGAACPLLEGAEAIERAALADFFGGKPTYTVYHPYPVSLTDLYEAVAPYC